METATKIASNTFSQVLARFFNAAISIVIVRIITGYLAAEGYGKYTIVYSFIAFFDIAADLGLFTIAVSEMAKVHHSKARMEHILRNIMSLRITLVIVLSIAATIAVFFFPEYDAEVRTGIIIAAVTMAFNHLSITLSSALQVHYKMPLNAFAIAFSKVVMVGLIYYIARQDLGFTMLIVAGLANNMLTFLLTYIFARRYMRIGLSIEIAEWKRLLGKTIVYGLSLICSAFFIYFSPLVLHQFTSTADVGVYGVANKIVQLLIILPFAFMNSVLPSLGKHLANRARVHDIIQHSFEVLATLGIGMLAGIVALAPSIIALASSGTEFAGAAPILSILTIGVFFLFLHNLFSYVLLALDKQRTLLQINALAALITIGANFLLIPLPVPFGGLTGAAIASVLPQLFVLICTYFTVRNAIQLRLSFGRMLKALIAAAVMGYGVWLIDTSFAASLALIPRLGLGTIVGVGIYGTLLYLTGSISPQAISIIKRQTGQLETDSPAAAASPVQKIAIDIRAIAAEKTGKEWYTLNILEALSALDHTNQYTLYTKYRYRGPTLPPNFQVRRIRLPLFIWHPVMFIDMLLRGITVLLATASYIAPSFCFMKRIKPIVVIHDTVAFLYPQRHQLKARLIEKYTVGLALKHAHAIVAVSEHTKQDLVKLFAVQPEQIRVIGEAARKTFHVITDKEDIKTALSRHNIPEPYLLFVGTLEPRKNLATLLKAFAALPERSTHKLVIVGKKGWYYAEIFRTVRELELHRDVIFTGYVDDHDLVRILNGARCFVLPSLYEGFGLPLLEAFACGTPVVTSDTSALREIAAGTCIMVDPLRVPDLTNALHRVLTDESLRAQITAAGYTRVQEYSWDRAASQLLAIINAL